MDVHLLTSLVFCSSIYPLIPYGLTQKTVVRGMTRTRCKSFGDKAFSTAAPKLWNKLPLKLQNCNTVSDFSKQLKSHLFEIAYEC